MTREPNPYRPGFNQQPAVLVGRDAILASADESLAVAAQDGHTPRPVILVGARGVGKTVSLNEISARALEELGWPTVHLELRPKTGFTPTLIERLYETTALLRGATVDRRGKLVITGGKVKAGAFGVGAEVELSPTRSTPTLPLDGALARCMEAATQRQAGVVLTIDEMQLANQSELAGFAATLQAHVPDQWPLVVVAAGLPSVREPSKAVTYLERSEWHELGLLNRADTLAALADPARKAGRPMSDAAAEVLADAAGGYPYAVQVLGHHAWRVSAGSKTINTAQAVEAVQAAQRDLSAGLYAGRWNDASGKEKEYLRALAELTVSSPGLVITGSEVAAHLGEGTRAVAYLRDRLLKKGTLFTQGRALQFVTPGMGRWILEQERDD